MDIAVITRTLNEEKLIAPHCKAYDWADAILIADGGSADRTLEIAREFPNVQIKPFTEWHVQKGVGRNPEGRHLNFLIDWATNDGYDWIILDDVDGLLTDALRINARSIFETASEFAYDTVYAFRLYIYETTKWFPQLTGGSLKPGPEWRSLWGWKPTSRIRWKDVAFGSEVVDPFLVGLSRFPVAGVNEYLLHYFCFDEELVQRKLTLYRDSGQIPEMKSWTETCGTLQELPKCLRPTYYPGLG
jgi:glycosyltransferase involved in cell wall biosynthesis